VQENVLELPEAARLAVLLAVILLINSTYSVWCFPEVKDFHVGINRSQLFFDLLLRYSEKSLGTY
jgi:hypothetical protein